MGTTLRTSHLPSFCMHPLNQRLDQYLNPSLPSAKKYKNLLALFRQGLSTKEEAKEAVVLRSDDIIAFFKESISYLEENQKIRLRSQVQMFVVLQETGI